MENALLVGLSRQTALRRELDVVANNLANVNTTGFKAESILFERTTMKHAAHDNFERSDRRIAFVQDWGSVRDLEQGALKRTGGDLDVAISGEGYLVVETTQGERYTRNGGLARNNAGEIVDAQGYRVLGEGGPIQLEDGDAEIAIAGDGTISAAGGQRGKLRLVTFENPQTLAQQGNGLYASPDPALPAGERARIVHGALEGSNVASVGEMTRMIEVTRAYQSLASLMQNADELRRKAVDELARTPS